MMEAEAEVEMEIEMVEYAEADELACLVRKSAIPPSLRTVSIWQRSLCCSRSVGC